MKTPAKKIETNKLCDYGCDKQANYKFMNGKCCCSDEWFRCPSKKKERSIQRKKDWKNWKNIDQWKENVSDGVKNAWLNKEKRDKWKKSMQGNNSLNINILRNRYPILFEHEDIKEKNNEIFVRCKECNIWFKPNYNSLYERIRQLKPDGNNGSYLFCSYKCKINSNFFCESLKVSKKQLKQFQRFSNIVWRYTRQTLKSHQIKNIELRGRNKYHLDHKYSIYEGFKNNINPKILSHHKNLQMIPEKINIQKSSQCSITLQELLSF